MTLTRKEQSHVSVLLYRADFLAKRIAAMPERDLTYDKAEVSALLWAIETLDPDVEVPETLRREQARQQAVAIERVRRKNARWAAKHEVTHAD